MSSPQVGNPQDVQLAFEFVDDTKLFRQVRDTVDTVGNCN